ncbi:unnamed protein product [Didymodactylos carnosus]|uniref:Uncharacterized protein n=1 Tax=Didymodactylos carnosus TaxID=1234261 RepID=A0A814MUT5_9BILA|nr:unnamed protein product [Didymodactylos carnosus]CAF1084368.1 unnamed protein product [Didymodactylos carnosus]CAF3706199.1 unnamed protein product [Didymodactylos carnosus]CAF3849999.1 unnamed protein product [Didymodactylos carnosus]
MQSGHQRSPPSPPQTSSKKLRQSTTTAMSANVESLALTLMVKEIFSSLSFVQQMCNSLLTSDLFTNSIVIVVKEAVNKSRYQVEDLKFELKKANDNILLLQGQTNDLAQYSKRKDLLLYSIPFKQNENTYDIVLELAASVELQLNKNDFYAIHRLPISKRDKDKSRQAIIISFLRFTDRNKNVFINEHLTPLNNHTFQYAKQNLNKQQVFTLNGNVYYYMSKANYRLLRSVPDIDGLVKLDE